MKKAIALALATIMALSLAACGGGNSSSSGSSGSTPAGDNSSSSSQQAGTPTPGGTLTFNLTSEPPEMNSITTTSTGSMNVIRHLMDGLTGLDQNDTPIPAAAESWDVENDGMKYTFHLRDAKWSNGDPVTAHDFVFAWNTHFTAATAADYAGTWAPYIKGAEEVFNAADDVALATALENAGWKAIDDKTFEVELAMPCPFFLSMMAFPSFMPMNEAFYTANGGLDTYGTEQEYFCTNGAFQVDSWIHESEFNVKKNPDYWDAANIMLDGISFKMIGDATAAYNSFVGGEIDVIEAGADQVEQAKASGLEVLSFNDASAWYLEFNVEAEGLGNADVRRAMTLGVDAESFIKNVLRNGSTVAYSYTPTAISQGTFASKVGKVLDRVADGNYAEVKKLLEEGLAEQGLTIETFKPVLIADDTSGATKNAAFLQEQWKTNLGVNVEINQMPYKNRLQAMSEHDFSIVLAGWGPDYNDPMTFIDIWVTGAGNNHTGWSNAEYDELVDKARNETNAETREGYMIEAEKILLDEMPIGPIYNRSKDYLVADRAKGVVRTGFQDVNLRWAYIEE